MTGTVNQELGGLRDDLGQMARGAPLAPATTASRAANYAVAVLFLVNVVGYLDRQILSLLVQPVKASLHLSDGEIGLMQGLAFVLTYCIAGLVIGAMIDRLNRRTLLLICVAIWSVCAAAGGLARNGGELFVARMGVGIGEAALIPAAVSLVADLFSAERRGRAYGLFTTGVYLGSGLSLVLVAFLLPLVTLWSGQLTEAGLAVEPWRLVMLSMILPGIVCCLLLATVAEPSRADRKPVPSWTTGLRDWRRDAGFLLPHHLALAAASLATYALAGWLPTVLIREHHLNPQYAGFVYGPAVAVSGMLGAYLGGVLADRGNRLGGVAGRLRIGIPCTLVALAGFGLIALQLSIALIILGGAMVTAGIGAAIVTGIMAMSDSVPPRSRGQITAIYFVFTGLIGAAGGPAIVGYLNDSWGGTALGPILGATGIAACVATIMLLLACARLAGRRPAAEDSPVSSS